MGLSAVVKVDTSDTSGRLAASARTEPVPGDLVSQAPAVDFAPVRRPSPASSGTTLARRLPRPGQAMSGRAQPCRRFRAGCSSSPPSGFR
ncbi:MAG: hypothetical protein ACLSHC_02300 [Bilophila wadsworthia]